MHRNIPSKAYQLVECIEQQLVGLEGNSRTTKSEVPQFPLHVQYHSKKKARRIRSPEMFFRIASKMNTTLMTLYWIQIDTLTHTI